MTDTNDEIRKPVGPGPRAVGFRTSIAGQTKTSKNKSEPASPNTPTAATTRNGSATPSAPITTSPRSAPPMNKRSKGSGFIGFVFVSGLLTVAYLIWLNFLHYQSYGVIEGRVISVGAPWDGTILTWQVRDGDIVKQGDIVATMSNLAMQHELAALGDELKMSQANLDAEMAKIKFSTQGQSERSQKATAEYLQSSGELMAEQALLKDLDRQLDRAERLYKSKNLSKSKYENLYFEYVGQKQKIEKLDEAVTILKSRSEEVGPTTGSGNSLLKPLFARIERTQAEMSRLREKIDQGQIKAPVSGRVAQRFCLTGESTMEGETVLEILEDNSIEAILYVPQSLTNEFVVGDDVEIQLEPYEHSLHCSVKRLGDQFEPAPAAISRYYTSEQYLLPVYLTPHGESDKLLSMRVNGTVKRPYQWQKCMTKTWVNLQEQLR